MRYKAGDRMVFDDNVVEILEVNERTNTYTINHPIGGEYLANADDFEKQIENNARATIANFEKQLQKDGDNVNHPAHYRMPGGGETIDIIEDVQGDNVKYFYQGNIIKYVCRYEQKGGSESLEKADWYLHKLIGLQKTIEEVEAGK